MNSFNKMFSDKIIKKLEKKNIIKEEDLKNLIEDPIKIKKNSFSIENSLKKKFINDIDYICNLIIFNSTLDHVFIPKILMKHVIPKFYLLENSKYKLNISSIEPIIVNTLSLYNLEITDFEILHINTQN